jgi:hypothetical protein
MKELEIGALEIISSARVPTNVSNRRILETRSYPVRCQTLRYNPLRTMVFDEKGKIEAS